MTDLDEAASSLEVEGSTDGRVARRERNINTVLDVVLDMFGEESLFPTIEQAATRSGLSLRSLYRYFADPGELLEACITRSRERVAGLGRLSKIGHGPLDERIDNLVFTRIGLYEAAGSVYRATVVNAALKPQIRAELTRVRDEFRQQLEIQFAPELKAQKAADRKAIVAAADVMTQLDSVDFFRRHRQRTTPETAAAMSTALRSLLS